MSLPTLSIILPAHNEEALMPGVLTQAVERASEWGAATEIVVACNGCSDRTAEISKAFPVTVIEDAHSGMSFGKNLGARAARHDLLLFWDVDTHVEPGGLTVLAEAIEGKGAVAGGFWTYPDKVYPRSLLFYSIMNHFCRRRRVPPAGAAFVSRSTFETIGGLDESIPQGTSSDLVRRARKAGAEYILVHTKKVRTSVRRFEKRGYLRQLLEWRRNIRLHSKGRKDRLANHEYEVIRD
ncbi:MAG: glycosyltransferase [Planctomycetota bacterium]|jgi:glycosyltransferase involved in cell wall biosynthesis